MYTRCQCLSRADSPGSILEVNEATMDELGVRRSSIRYLFQTVLVQFVGHVILHRDKRIFNLSLLANVVL